MASKRGRDDADTETTAPNGGVGDVSPATGGAGGGEHVGLEGIGADIDAPPAPPLDKPRTFRFVGAPLRGKPHHFSGFQCNEHVVLVGNALHLTPEPGQEPYVAILNSVHESKAGAMVMSVRWFYRLRDSDLAEPPRMGGSGADDDGVIYGNEVYLSPQADENPIESFFEPAYVKFGPTLEERQVLSATSIGRPKSVNAAKWAESLKTVVPSHTYRFPIYFCRFNYDPTRAIPVKPIRPAQRSKLQRGADANGTSQYFEYVKDLLPPALPHPGADAQDAPAVKRPRYDATEESPRDEGAAVDESTAEDRIIERDTGDNGGGSANVVDFVSSSTEDDDEGEGRPPDRDPTPGERDGDGAGGGDDDDGRMSGDENDDENDDPMGEEDSDSGSDGASGGSGTGDGGEVNDGGDGSKFGPLKYPNTRPQRIGELYQVSDLPGPSTILVGDDDVPTSFVKSLVPLKPETPLATVESEDADELGQSLMWRIGTKAEKLGEVDREEFLRAARRTGVEPLIGMRVILPHPTSGAPSAAHITSAESRESLVVKFGDGASVRASWSKCDVGPDMAGCVTEDALQALLRREGDGEAALKDVREAVESASSEVAGHAPGPPSTRMRGWTLKEDDAFFRGWNVHGKNFVAIRAAYLPHRKVGDLVNYYYTQKRDARQFRSVLAKLPRHVEIASSAPAPPALPTAASGVSAVGSDAAAGSDAKVAAQDQPSGAVNGSLADGHSSGAVNGESSWDTAGKKRLLRSEVHSQLGGLKCDVCDKRQFAESLVRCVRYSCRRIVCPPCFRRNAHLYRGRAFDANFQSAFTNPFWLCARCLPPSKTGRRDDGDGASSVRRSRRGHTLQSTRATLGLENSRQLSSPRMLSSGMGGRRGSRRGDRHRRGSRRSRDGKRSHSLLRISIDGDSVAEQFLRKVSRSVKPKKFNKFIKLLVRYRGGHYDETQVVKKARKLFKRENPQLLIRLRRWMPVELHETLLQNTTAADYLMKQFNLKRSSDGAIVPKLEGQEDAEAAKTPGVVIAPRSNTELAGTAGELDAPPGDAMADAAEGGADNAAAATAGAGAGGDSGDVRM